VVWEGSSYRVRPEPLGPAALTPGGRGSRPQPAASRRLALSAGVLDYRGEWSMSRNALMPRPSQAGRRHQVAPSILAADFGALASEVAKVSVVTAGCTST